MPPALNGFLRFTDALHHIGQPDDSATNPDWGNPTTSIDCRIDCDLSTWTAGRVFAGRGIASGSQPWVWLTGTTTNRTGFNREGAGFWEPTINGYFVLARHQYRFTYSGTTLGFYKRDPDDGLTLDDNSGWTLVGENDSYENISTLQTPVSPFVLMRRLNDEGWSAVDWYEFYLAIDGSVVSLWRGGDVPLDTGTDTFTDTQAQTWTWQGTDPTQVPNTGGAVLEVAGDLPALGMSTILTALSDVVVGVALPGLEGGAVLASSAALSVAGDLPGLGGLTILQSSGQVAVAGELPGLDAAIFLASETVTTVVAGVLPNLGASAELTASAALALAATLSSLEGSVLVSSGSTITIAGVLPGLGGAMVLLVGEPGDIVVVIGSPRLGWAAGSVAQHWQTGDLERT